MLEDLMEDFIEGPMENPTELNLPAVVLRDDAAALAVLVSRQAPPPDRNPALVYLARSAPGSRRTMTKALTVMARLLTARRCDLWTLAWEELRYAHTAALRSVLAERLLRQPSTRCWPPCAGHSRNAGGWVWSLPRTFNARRTCPPFGVPHCPKDARCPLESCGRCFERYLPCTFVLRPCQRRFLCLSGLLACF